MRTTVNIPDELLAQAQEAGLNISATTREALRQRLNSEGEAMLARVEALLGGLDAMDLADAALGEMARALARKIDAARWSDSAAMAVATPALVRELASLVEGLRADATRSDAVSDLIARRAERLAFRT